MKIEKLAQYIDHTSLAMGTTPERIEGLCREAMEWHVASVCIPPSYVNRAAELLRGSPVAVGTVIGFPLGYSAPIVKIREAEIAQRDGADEIDIVIQLGLFIAGEYRPVEEELTSIIQVTPGLIHKVIIECALLNPLEKESAVSMVTNCGAEYVKTSTGFGPHGATLEDVRLLSDLSNGKIKVKASGGIRDLPSVLALIRAGAERIGTSSAMKILGECQAGSEQS
jgi:deoxyribose-phosphate aldolase